VISDYSIENVKHDKSGKIIDYVYEMFPTDDFCEEMLNLNKQKKRLEIQSGKRLADDAIIIDSEDDIVQIVED
jgi:hypothetical protein